MLISVNLLTYNGERFIGGCLESVLHQTYSDIELLIIDNASQDKTIHIAQNLVAQRHPAFSVRIIQGSKNLGFAVGHNLGIKESKGDLVLCLNQDVILAPDFAAKASAFFKNCQDERIGAIQPKLLRLDKDLRTTDIIDTTGLAVLKNRRIIARGQGEKDAGQYNAAGEIFGADGAAPVYKRETLEDIKIEHNSTPAPPLTKGRGESGSGEYFDDDFFMYKEDVDLAWRLRLFGWKTLYVPEVFAWHARGSGDSAAINYFSIIKERRKISQIAKFLSFRNQRLLQIKNELPGLLFKHLPWFLPKEIGALGYAMLFEKRTFRAIKEIFKLLPSALRKREQIMSRKRIGAGEMEKWFG